MTLSNRRILHDFNHGVRIGNNYHFNNHILRKEKKVPVYQFESDVVDFEAKTYRHIEMAIALLIVLVAIAVCLT